ncbi:hypothetical protein RF55_17439, partial [Lasius niger]
MDSFTTRGLQICITHMGKLKDEVGSLYTFISGALPFRKGAIRISNSFPSFIGGCVKKARLEVDSVTVGDPGQSELLRPHVCLEDIARTAVVPISFAEGAGFHLQTFLAGWLSRSGFLRDVPSIPSSLPLFCSSMRHVSLVREKCGINIWMGIIGDHLIGPYMLPPRLNGPIYVRFLEEQEFGERWIGRTGPVQWPPRSPDLTPLEFFLWGYLKSLVYDTPIKSEEDLMARIMAACEVTQAMPNILAQ